MQYFLKDDNTLHAFDDYVTTAEIKRLTRNANLTALTDDEFATKVAELQAITDDEQMEENL